jgi:hypothetical protein
MVLELAAVLAGLRARWTFHGHALMIGRRLASLPYHAPNQNMAELRLSGMTLRIDEEVLKLKKKKKD